MAQTIRLDHGVAQVEHRRRRRRELETVDVELMRCANGRFVRSVHDVQAEPLAQIPEDVRPDLTVVVRLAVEAQQAEPVGVGLAVDGADPGRGNEYSASRVSPYTL